MSEEYPVRPKMSPWGRYPCMALGFMMIFDEVKHLIHNVRSDIDHVLWGLLIGGIFFFFGFYGGLPLVNTVQKWYPTTDTGEVNNMHRHGLKVIRRREGFTYLSFPLAFIIMMIVSLTPILDRTVNLEKFFSIIAAVYIFINSRYILSRCPRCGYGFFARGTNRASMLKYRKTCGHCGLSLYAYKEKSHLT